MAWLRRLAWVGVVVYWGGICILTHLSPETIAKGPKVWDKATHFFSFFGLGAALATAMLLTWPYRRRVLLWVMLAAMLYSALDELTQPYFRRSASIYDWLADMTGVIPAVLLAGIVQHWLIGRQRTTDDTQEMSCNSSSLPTTSQP
jgi:VanZ family protein